MPRKTKAAKTTENTVKTETATKPKGTRGRVKKTHEDVYKHVDIMHIIKIISSALGRNVTQIEVSRALGSSNVGLNKRLRRGADFRLSEIVTLEKHFGCGIFDIISKEGRVQDGVEIPYYENEAFEGVIKNPAITSIWLDREMVRSIWKMNEKDLRIIAMPGDSMDGKVVPFKNQDILVIDTRATDLIASGIYAYTTEDKNIFVNGLKRKIDGTVEFYYWNESYEKVSYPISVLEEQGFKIIGRIIKNVTSRI